MEELKLLINMVEKLPALAIWVGVIFFAYKVVVVGSVYGIIRFLAKTVASVIGKHRGDVELRGLLEGECITYDGTHVKLIAQLKRLKGIHLVVALGSNTSSRSYIHTPDVKWLENAIDKALAEAEEKK